MNIFYDDLAPYWPLLSPVADYASEATELLQVLEARAPEGQTLLELGSGGGHVAYYLKRRFALTLTDVSPAMLSMSKQLNPECEHLVGDMRLLELERAFDVVLAHDAVDYMLTEADLRAALLTAHRHLRPGGLALFVPDHVKERFTPSTDCGGSDGADGRAARFLEWSDWAVGREAGTVHYSFLIRKEDGSVRALHEKHTFGLFAQATWERLFREAGFAVEVIEERTEEERAPRLLFAGRKAS